MSEPTKQPKGGVRVSARAISAIVVGVLALIFIFSNLRSGTISFLGLDFVQPVWVWFLIVFVAGVIVGSLFPWFRHRKKR